MTRDEYYNKVHNDNLKSWKELVKRVASGILKIVDIRVDAEQFGHTRVTIFFHEDE